MKLFFLKHSLKLAKAIGQHFVVTEQEFQHLEVSKQQIKDVLKILIVTFVLAILFVTTVVMCTNEIMQKP